MKRAVAAVLVGTERGRVLVMSDFAMRREVHDCFDHFHRCWKDRECEQDR